MGDAMDALDPGYERTYDLVERPFSLTPDEKYHFRSAAHRRAQDAVAAAQRRNERFVLITGDLGAGKTTLCRTLVGQLLRQGPAAFVPNPLLRPEDLLRLLLQDFEAVSPEEVRRGRLAGASRHELGDELHHFLLGLQTARHAVVIIDEAQLMPSAIVEQVVQLSGIEHSGRPLMHFVLASQSTGYLQSLTEQRLDPHLASRARLTPLERDECGAYIAHRLTIAGGAPDLFTPRAVDAIYDLSGGLPRLVNLLCERALQVAGASGARRVEPAAIESAASALDLLRARPKRFRWFGSRVS
ncbi:MAG: ExeA family protein [Vicinamibacteria bacterium]